MIIFTFYINFIITVLSESFYLSLLFGHHRLFHVNYPGFLLLH